MRSSSSPHDAESRTLLRWHHYLATDGSVYGLREFHARHRLLLLAHDSDDYRALGAVVDSASVAGLAATHARYEERLTHALSQRVSRARHLNVLEHAAQTVLARLSDEERQALTAVLRDYRRADVELSVPRDLLRRTLRRAAPHSWAARQTYLEPRPALAATD